MAYTSDLYGNKMSTRFGEQFDTEDQGMKGYNLRSEPFYNRLKAGSKISEVFESLDQNKNDPLTPVLHATLNDPITVNLFMPGDRSRATTFTIHAFKN